MPVCARCGAKNPGGNQVCTDCGTPMAAQTPGSAKPARLGRTVLGMPAFDPAAHPDRKDLPAAPPPPERPPPQPRPNATMLGMPSPLAQNRPSSQASDPTAPAERSPSGRRDFGKTLLGVAQPGIAPIHQEQPPSPPPLDPPEKRGSPQPLPLAGDRPSPRQPAEVGQEIRLRGMVPNSSVNHPAATQRRSQVRPLLLFMGAIVVAASIGALAAVLRPRPAEVTVAGFEASRDGADQVILECKACGADTTVRHGKTVASFEAGQATLRLDEPLKVGTNALELELEGDRDETVQVRIPVAFRLDTDLAGRAAIPPYARIVVRVPPSARVEIGGHGVPVEDGTATERISFEEEARGQQATIRKITRQVPVLVETPNVEKNTTAELQVGITPLVLDTPAPFHVLSQGPLIVSGHTVPGAQVKAGDVSGTADEKGRFTLAIESPAAGDLTIVAVGKDMVGRYDKVELLSAPQSTTNSMTPSSYTALAPGAEAAIVGSVVESRIVGGVTNAIVEVEGCTTPPCLVRLVHGEAKRLTTGDRVQATGLIREGEPPVMLAAQLR